MAFDYSVKFEAIDKITATINKINKKVEDVQNKIKKSTALSVNTQKAMSGLNRVHNKIKEISNRPIDLGLSVGNLVATAMSLGAPINKAIELEKAFAGVTKVIDGTDEQIAKLKDGIVNMTSYIPKTAVELTEIAEAGAKMGIPIEEIEKYTELVAKASVAFDLLPAEAGNAFGKIANQLGYSINDLEEYGNIVNTLADSMATDSKNIIDITKRTSGVMSSLNFDKQSVAGLSAFADQMSVSSEVGATAMNQILNAIRQTEKGSKILAEKGAYGLIDIVEEFKKLEGMDRVKAIQDLMGVGEGSRMFEKMINQADVLGKTLDVAYSDKTLNSMNREFENVSNTTANKVILLRNAYDRLMLKIGDNLLPDIRSLIEFIGPLIDGVGEWVANNRGLIVTLARILAVSGLITAVFLSLKLAVMPILLAFKLYVAIIKVATIVQGIFNAVMALNPIVWIVLGVIALIGAIALLIYYWEDITKWVGELWDKFTGFITSLNLVENAIGFVKGAFEVLTAPIRYVIDLIDTFLSKFDIYNQAKEKITDLAEGAWSGTKSFFGFGDEDKENSDNKMSDKDNGPLAIDNTTKNHSVIDVNIKADGGEVVEQKATSNNGKVRLNNVSNGI